MKLILDEWIVREVIDTLYMARTTLLGITGLDSPRDVEKKSANETAITRRVNKAIDIIQQSEQPYTAESLDEAAEQYAKNNYLAPDFMVENLAGEYDSEIDEYKACTADAFKAGAEWVIRQLKEDQYDSTRQDLSFKS